MDWKAIMKNVPPIEETQNAVEARSKRSQSPISNITDITVNENRVKFLNTLNQGLKPRYASTQDRVF